MDGIRAIAIGGVVAFHCLSFAFPPHTFAAYAARITRAGWGGVDVFFVLSGYLVGGLLLDGRGQSHQLRRFLIRRFTRIIPLYALVVASAYVTPLLVADEASRTWLFGGATPWWTLVTLTQNVAVPIFGQNIYLSPTWSLAVEAQIYLLLGMVLTRSPSRLILSLMIGGVAVAEICRLVAWISGHGLYGYFMMPARIDGACLGVITALVVRNASLLSAVRRNSKVIWWAAATLVAMVAPLTMLNQSGGSPGANIYTHLALAIASAATIATLRAAPTAAINRALRAPALVALGTISYGVYLLHVPVIGLTHALIGRTTLAIDGWRSAGATALGIITTILLAKLSWYRFEKPLLRWSQGISRVEAAVAKVPMPSGPVAASLKTTQTPVSHFVPLAADINRFDQAGVTLEQAGEREVQQHAPHIAPLNFFGDRGGGPE